MQSTSFKVLLFGPVTPPYNGQSVAFTLLVESLSKGNFILFNTAKFNNRFFNTARCYFFLPFFFLFNRFESVYFTSSRSRLGFLKDLPLFLFSIFFKKKIINHLHGKNFKAFYKNSGLLKPIVTFCYNRVHTSIVLLEAMKSEYDDFPKMKLKIVPNCYDSEFDNYAPTFPKPLRIIYLSNLMKSKGILEFLEAADSLLTKYPELKIEVAGQFLSDHLCSHTEVKQIFYSLFNSLKEHFPNRIQYLGVLEGKQKIQTLLKSSIFILPTYHPSEAFPISILEAMKTGNAIVTTNHNHLRHIISERNGILINPQSAKSIVKGINFLLSDKMQLEKTQKFNAHHVENFNYKNYTDKLNQIIYSE